MGIMKPEIIPAIMPEQYEEIESMAGMVKNYIDTVQLDLMDGRYVPEKTWPFVYGTDRDLQDLLSEETSLPFWNEVNYELDLMIERPEEDLDTWLNIGASRIIFHHASVHSWEAIKNIDPVVREFVVIGCAVTIHDNLEDIFPLIEDGTVRYVQVMGIAHIGYQGEAFESGSLELIQTLRNRYPELEIGVDGGVSENSIKDLYRAGATRFVSGSAVFHHGIVSENISRLLSLISE